MFSKLSFPLSSLVLAKAFGIGEKTSKKMRKESIKVERKQWRLTDSQIFCLRKKKSEECDSYTSRQKTMPHVFKLIYNLDFKQVLCIDARKGTIITIRKVPNSFL